MRSNAPLREAERSQLSRQKPKGDDGTKGMPEKPSQIVVNSAKCLVTLYDHL